MKGKIFSLQCGATGVTTLYCTHWHAVSQFGTPVKKTFPTATRI